MESLASLFVSSLYDCDDDEKIKNLTFLPSLSSFIEILEVDEKQGLRLITELFSWLPLAVEGASVVFGILEGLPCRIDGVFEAAKTFLVSLTNDILFELNDELIEMGDEERDNLSDALLSKLSVVMKSPGFLMIEFDGFEFNMDLLQNFKLDRDDKNKFLQLLRVLNDLPKEKITEISFTDFMQSEVELVASLYPLILKQENQWILDIGADFRISLALSVLPEFDEEDFHTLNIDRNNIVDGGIW